MYVGIVNSKIMEHCNKLPGIKFTHKISWNPVIWLSQSPLKSNHLSISLMTGITRSPWLTCNHICLLNVWHQITWGESILHSQSIEKWLNGRTHLTPTVHCHVIHEMVVIKATHISLDSARMRLHAYKPGTQEWFVITNAIHRRHHRINISLIRKYRHVSFGPEGTPNFLFWSTSSLHGAITFTLLHCLSHNALHLLRRKFICKRRIGLSAIFTCEQRLKILGNMTVDRILRILLHARIYGRVNL